MPSLSIMTEFCEDLLASAGTRFAGPIAILRNWTYCLFYVMAELPGCVESLSRRHGNGSAWL